jgi:hypothetical protein
MLKCEGPVSGPIHISFLNTHNKTPSTVIPAPEKSHVLFWAIQSQAPCMSPGLRHILARVSAFADQTEAAGSVLAKSVLFPTTRCGYQPGIAEITLQ